MKTKKTRYAHYNINYHFVWIPKYRRKILTFPAGKSPPVRAGMKGREIISPYFGSYGKIKL